nr:hypothetical protein [Nitrospira defluvii]
MTALEAPQLWALIESGLVYRNRLAPDRRVTWLRLICVWSTIVNSAKTNHRTHCREALMDLENKSDAEILAIADPIMDNLMEASTAIDHARHVRDFTDRLKAIVTKDYLERVCRQYQTEKGTFGARTPVAVFRRPGSIAIVWRQQFTDSPGDYVAEMVLVQQGSRYLVDHVFVL